MKTRRRGYTLVEMLVVIVLISTVLGTMTVTLYSLNRATGCVRDDFSQQLQLQRLTDALRTDVHQAKSVAVTPVSDAGLLSNCLKLTMLDGTTVTYAIGDEWMDRQIRQNGQVVGGDQYPLPPGSAEWRIDRDRDAPLISIRMNTWATRRAGRVAKTICINAAACPPHSAAADAN